jgi:membrane dipeptidase
MCLRCFAGTVPPSQASIKTIPTSENNDVRQKWFERGRRFLAVNPSIDIHAHPGRFFMRPDENTELLQLLGPVAPQEAIRDMVAGHVGGVVFALVADHCLLALGDRGLRARREFEAGEAFAEYVRQMQALDEVLAEAATSGPIKVRIDRAVEGGDFIEAKLDRIGAAASRGVRSITIVHYHTNQIGDTQTEDAVHGGLTPLGAQIVREMEKHRVLVDLAHASYETCRAVARKATRPMLISHSNLRRPGQDHPRLISVEHARLVTDTGGLVGAIPAGFNQTNFADYIDTLCFMVDALGIDHIAIGTDMDYTYRPVMASYRDWPLIPGALLHKGFQEYEVAKIMAGNLRRVYGE